MSHSMRFDVHSWVALGAAAVFVVGGGALAWRHATTPLATPRSVLVTYLEALQAGDASRASALTTPDIHATLMRGLCTRRYEAAKHVYETVIPGLARPAWDDIRRRAEGLAITEAMRIRSAIESAGREAVGRLPPDKIQVLIEDGDLFDEFVACQGAATLSAEDRGLIGDPLQFWHASGRLSAWSGASPLGDDFIIKAAWPQLPAGDKTVLATQDALRASMTADKLACFDRLAKDLLAPQFVDVPGRAGYALPGDWSIADCSIVLVTPPPVPATPATREQVSPDYRPRIEGIAREDVADLDTFVIRHGEATARGVLQDAQLGPPARPVRERFPAIPAGGFLRRTHAEAATSVGVRGAATPVLAEEVRSNGAWLITSLSPELFSALPEVPR